MKGVLLVAMSILYVIAGVNHFVHSDVYVPMMPPYLPWHQALIYLSGAAEIGLGLAVVVPSLRDAAAWGLIIMLIAIFPANIHIAVHDVPLFGRAEGFGVWNWARLPFQAVLIAWAWCYTDD